MGLEKRLGKEFWKEFDIVCGTSTGALIAVLLGLYDISIDKIRDIYLKGIKTIFPYNRSMLISSARLVMKHAIYNEHSWENFIMQMCGDLRLYDVSHLEKKVIIVSTRLDKPSPEPALWQNFNSENIDGIHASNTVSLLEALRSTTAAPSLFPPKKIGGIHFAGRWTGSK